MLEVIRQALAGVVELQKIRRALQTAQSLEAERSAGGKWHERELSAVPIPAPPSDPALGLSGASHDEDAERV